MPKHNLKSAKSTTKNPAGKHHFIKRFLYVSTFKSRFFNTDMLINKPGCSVCFYILHNFGQRQIQNGGHLLFKEYVILCIFPVKKYFFT